MPARVERIKVEVMDSIEGETRTFNITMTAPTTDFQLSDLLQHRGVISALNGELKLAIRVATETYLARAEALIATLKTGSTTTPDTRSNGKRPSRTGTGKAPTTRASSELNRAVTPMMKDAS